MIALPDGDMGDYMASLEKLRTQGPRLLPGHGDPVETPQRLVRGMMGHRKQREGQILRLLGQKIGDIPAMVEKMYVGLDPRLTGAAGRSVLAHLIDLQQRGVVTGREDGAWRMS